MISVDEELIPIQTRFAKEYNLHLVLKELNHPEKLIPTINVVGSNGKGSTSYFLSQGLQKKYQKVGLFISPAFLYHNERIQINNQPISDDDLKKYLKNVESLIFKYHLTFFEIWTLIMILYFVDQKVEIAVIEAGIGGLKDATQVMSHQLMVLLTSVSYDHTEILGMTIEEILRQKMGITRPNTLLIISDDNQKYQREISKISKIQKINFEWAGVVDNEIEYQKANQGLALACLKKLGIVDEKKSQWILPLGRFTILKDKPKLILDGAHNPDGIAKLIKTLKRQNLEPIILYATSQKKDYFEMLNLLTANFSQVYVTDFQHFKSWEISKLNYPLKVKDWQKFLWENKKRDVVVCGSLYFIPQVYQWYINQSRGDNNSVN